MAGPARERLRGLALPHVPALLDAAVANVRSGRGGPFSALVLPLDGGPPVACGANRVTTSLDPTAHAEVEALRAAGRALGTPVLRGCLLVASCEPCPLCLAACLWSRLDAVVWLADRQDAAAAGFDDAELHRLLGSPDPLPDRLGALELVRIAHPRALEPFEAWAAYDERVPY